MRKRFALLLALTAVCSMGAEHRTANFIVVAANQEVCQKVGQWAEHYRKEKAMLWLGREMPAWPQPCPLRVSITMDPPSGETEFTFGYSGVSSQRMQIRGPLDRMIYSVLPHEITHTVFAYHFKSPVPRWADEGGSVLSEDDPERDRHDKLVRDILNKNKQVALRTLFGVREYHQTQVMCLYAQGYSVADYLVKRGNRQHFLSFVGYGMQYGWDHAAKSHFGHNMVEELEQAWLKNLRDTKGQSQQQILASNQNTNSTTNASFMGNTSGKTVRLTLPPVQPLDPEPIARGAMPSPSGVRLEAPVPISMEVPRAVLPPSPSPSPGVQLGMPVGYPR
jgi:hypothetical protein